MKFTIEVIYDHQNWKNDDEEDCRPAPHPGIQEVMWLLMMKSENNESVRRPLFDENENECGHFIITHI